MAALFRWRGNLSYIHVYNPRISDDSSTSGEKIGDLTRSDAVFSSSLGPHIFHGMTNTRHIPQTAKPKKGGCPWLLIGWPLEDHIREEEEAAMWGRRCSYWNRK